MRPLLLALAVAACSSKQPERTPAAAAAAPAASISVRVDPRVELFSIVMRLSGAEEYQRAPEGPYRTAVDAHFAPFRDHPAIAATQALRGEAGIGYDAPMSLAAHLDGVPSLTPVVPLTPHPEGLDRRWQNVAVDDYLAKLRDFARASDFDRFWREQAVYRAAVEERLGAFLSRDDLAGWFDRFFGAYTGPGRVVVPGLLTGPQNYGAWMRAADGGSRMLPVVMLESVDAAGLPQPTDATVDLVVHEMAHTYVNPIVDRHAAELEQPASRVFAWVAEPMAKQAYPHWSIMVKESVVRAVVALHAADARGADAGRREIEAQEERSFVWTADMVAALERYRTERAASQRDLDGHFPEIVKLWQELSVRYASGLPPRPFRGPINAVFAGTGEVVLIAPAAQGAPKLAASVAAVRAKLFAQSRLLETAGVKFDDLPAARVVVWASPSSSPVVAALLTRAGASVDPDGVTVGGKRFAGAGLALILAVPHPRDPTAGVLIYAAARDEDLAGVNALFHGPTDWVVARKDGNAWVAVDRGDF